MKALTRDLADRLLDNGAALWNLYGPTETTVYSSACRVEGGETPISIGLPIANTRLYVLDNRMQAVSVGIPGELYIGGDGLARGYLNRPALTAERFVPSPFQAGARLYRTGDQVRWRPDKTLEFLGRLDHQVKLRGFRIELAEIEAVLGGYQDVSRCVATLREDAPGEKRLVAYWVARPDARATSSDLREYLRAQLPDYMIPAAFVRLDGLPMTAKRQDRSPGVACTRSRPGPTSVRATWLRELASKNSSLRSGPRSWVWNASVSTTTSSSSAATRLLAMRVIARANSVLDVDLAVRRLFETPTIAALAAEVTVQRAAGSDRAGSRLGADTPGRESCDPALLRPAATLVPGTARRRTWLPTTCRSRCGCGDVWTRSRYDGRWRLSSSDTNRCERPFGLQDGEPVQVIQAPSRFDLPLGRSWRPAAGASRSGPARTKARRGFAIV